MEGKQRILFVCTGNTCRSPMAAGLLRHLLAEESEGDKFVIESAGLAAWPGAPAAGQAVEVAAGEGIDLGQHRARQLTAEMVAAATMIITMTAEHRDAVLALTPEAEDKVFTLIELGAGGKSGAGLDIGDPFGGSLEIYRRTWEEIARHLERAWHQLFFPPGREKEREKRINNS